WERIPSKQGKGGYRAKEYSDKGKTLKRCFGDKKHTECGNNPTNIHSNNITMEKNTYTILIIDDHPLIVQAYKLALEEIKNTIEDIIFNIAVSHDCTTALNTINNAITHSKKIDLVLLDISLPPSEDGKILSGEDLGIKIRSLWHETKIIVSTTYSDTFRIHTIIKNINPEGFLVKNDLEPAELVQAVKTVLNGKL